MPSTNCEKFSVGKHAVYLLNMLYMVDEFSDNKLMIQAHLLNVVFVE